MIDFQPFFRFTASARISMYSSGLTRSSDGSGRSRRVSTSARRVEEHEDLSTTLRELMGKGRVLPGIEKYRRGEASLEKAARLAGVSMARRIEVPRE